MKILVVSDLHLQEYPCFTDIERIINKLAEADVICLCGDIVSLNIHNSSFYKYPINPYIFRMIASKYKYVIYVKGNHEFWGAENWVQEEIRAATNINNLFILDNGKVSIEGQDFLGATMWYQETGDAISKSLTFADFAYIPHHMQNVWKQNENTQRYFKENVTSDSIVITHHLPSIRSVPQKFRDSDINDFFVCNWGEKIIESKQPKLWLHGHTHSNCDYVLDKTRVVCNPYGYPFELNKDFKSDLIIEV